MPEKQRQRPDDGEEEKNEYTCHTPSVRHLPNKHKSNYY
jgi:hypothetical protein